MNEAIVDAGAMRQIGPYELEGTIAEGAMSVVHLGVDRTTGERHAIKVLSGTQIGDVESFRREINTLRRLRHPGIVVVHHTGLLDGVPWYSMEHLAGGTLRELWDGASEADRQKGIWIVQALCEPLAFLHGEGIVHRDLKPDNIAFRGDGTPVIMDFGLISRFGARVGRDAIEVGGAIIGTVDYMAPEQVRSEYVDARADLYSLGCILHEAITGRPPFQGGPWDVMQQHLDAPSPPRPSARTALASDRLDEIVTKLLAKAPADRFGYAVDVARAIADVSHHPCPPATDSRVYLYRPGFVGRTSAMKRIEAVLDRCRARNAGLVLVAGQSGSGKTRLAMEATRVAAAHRFMVFTGECLPIDGSDRESPVRAEPLHPLGPVLRAVAEQCALRGGEGTAELLGRRSKTLAPYEASLTTVPDFDLQPEPVPLNPQAARARVLADLAETVVALSRDEPLLIVLDDLQWADDMTIGFLESLGGGALDGGRVVILGTYRTEEVGPWIRSIGARPGVEEITVDSLSAPAARDLIGGMLAITEPPESLVGFLSTASEGNPFFIAEYLRASVSEGYLVRSAEGEWTLAEAASVLARHDLAVPLPQTLRELVVRRIGGLEGDADRLLQAAAVLGREFDLILASRLAELDDDQRMDAVSELLKRQIIELRPDVSYRFAHDKLREVVSQQLASELAASLHGRAAALLEAAYADRPDFPRHYASLAHHHYVAGAIGESSRYFGLAGEYALDAGSYDDCLRFLSRAFELDDRLESGPASERRSEFERARWNRLRGVASFGLGKLDQSIEYTEAALRALGERIPSTTLGWLWVLLSELPGQAIASRVASPIGRRGSMLDDRRFEIAAASDQLATSSYYAALVMPALANLVRGINRAEQAGFRASLPESCARLGFIAGAAGLDRISTGYFARARAGRALPRHEGRRAAALYMEAMHAVGRAEWERCRSLSMSSAEALERLGDRHEAEVALTIGANGLYYEGRHAESLAQSARMQRSAATHGSPTHLAWGAFMMGRSRLAMGHILDSEAPEEVEALIDDLESARSVLQPLPDSLSLAMCEGTLAWGHLLCGNDARAVAIAELLVGRFSRGMRPSVPQCLEGYAVPGEILLRRWERMVGSGSQVAARRAAVRACAELKRFAGRFRLAAPASLRCVGWQMMLRGRTRSAEKYFDRSIRAAQELEMPFEQLQTRFLVSRSSTEPERAAHHGLLAGRLAAEIGCSGYLRAMRRLYGQGATANANSPTADGGLTRHRATESRRQRTLVAEERISASTRQCGSIRRQTERCDA